MKKIVALTVICAALSGCHYLGEPEAYTVVEEERAPVVAPAPVAPAPVYQAPVYQQAPMYNGGCGCGAMGMRAGGCQMNPGVSPLTITIPATSVCIP